MMSTSKSVLITGATGLLGRQVVKAFRGKDWTVQETGLSRADGKTILKLDLANDREVETLLTKTRPNVVVHCAANRFPDKVEKDPDGTKKLNIEATRTLARLCAAQSVLLIYISTDYVFSGKEGEAPYEADAPTGPTNLYGQTKLDGEKAMLDEYGKAGKSGLGVVLRVPALYGPAEMPTESAINVLMDVLWNAQKSSNPIKMDHWALRFPTCTEDVARVCHDVAAKYLGATNQGVLPRVLQFSSEDRYTKYEICQLFGEIMGLPINNIEPNTQGNDPKASVQRPYDCHLSTKELKDLDIEVWTQDLTAWWRREVGAFRR